MADTRTPLWDLEGLRLFGSALVLAHELRAHNLTELGLSEGETRQLRAALARIGGTASHLDAAKSVCLREFVFSTWDLFERQDLVLFLVEPEEVNWGDFDWLDPIWRNFGLHYHLAYLTRLFFDYASEDPEELVILADVPPGFVVFERLTKDLTKPPVGRGAPAGRRIRDALNKATYAASFAQDENHELSDKEAARLALEVYPWCPPSEAPAFPYNVVVANSKEAAVNRISERLKADRLGVLDKV